MEKVAINKLFEDLQIGDTVCGDLFFGWQFISLIPDDVAETWISQHFPESVISKTGQTPSTGPVQKWEKGFGIVVASPTALPGKERLILLHKAVKQDFRLYRSTEIRKEKSRI